MRIIIEVENEVVKTVIETGEGETSQLTDENSQTPMMDAGAAPAFDESQTDILSDESETNFLDDDQDNAGEPHSELVELLGDTPGSGTLQSPKPDSDKADTTVMAVADNDEQNNDGGSAPIE